MILLLLAVLDADAQTAKEIAARDGANLQRPSWSTDGKKLAYEANYHEKQVIELYTGDPKTGGWLKVVPAVRSASAMTSGFKTQGTQGGLVAHELDWSPAALGRFVYAASNDDLDYDLYLGAGGALAAAAGADGGPAWSPDGRWIVFTSARSGQGDLYLLDLNAVDAAPKRLTSDADAAELFATWAPDSKRVVFVGHSDKGDNLWLLPGLDQPAAKLTDLPRSQVRPSFSPAGDRVAFYANVEEEGRFDLYVVEPKTGASPVKVATDVVLNAAGPTWTPDGKHLIVVLDDDDRYDPLVAVPIANPSAAKVLDLGTVGHGDLDVAKLADGKLWIAYAAQGKKADTKRTFDKLYVSELPALP